MKIVKIKNITANSETLIHLTDFGDLEMFAKGMPVYHCEKEYMKNNIWYDNYYVLGEGIVWYYEEKHNENKNSSE